jgi:class 3 adenylate cyclase
MVPSVLLVDDEPDNLKEYSLSMKLNKCNWKMLIADGILEAKKVIADQLQSGEPISVVLTDFVLDKTTNSGGFEMIQAAHELDPSILAIIYSGYPQLDRYAAFQHGAFDVVEKAKPGAPAVDELRRKTEIALKFRAFTEQINQLSRFFDRRVVNSVLHDESMLQLKNREATFAFWDIQGFSKFCEAFRTKPTVVSDFLQEFSEAAARIIFDNNGVLERFIGDGAMAIFGVLNSDHQTDHQTDPGAAAAAEAALAIRTAFDGIVQRSEPIWDRKAEGRKIRIGLRCGIHTGDALVGRTGSNFREQFTAIGSNANMAARIQTEADGDSRQILVSLPTKYLIESKFRMTLAKVTTLKDFDGNFQLFSVDGHV